MKINEFKSYLRSLIKLIVEDSMRIERKFNADKDNPNIISSNEHLKHLLKGSKMVNNNGDPLIFYHGTKRDFITFSKSFVNTSGTAISTNYLGFFFTTSPNVAEIYISKKFDPKQGRHPHGKILRYCLNIKNPYFITEKTYWKWGRSSIDEIEDMVQHLKSRGYDGIVMTSVWRGKDKNSYDAVVFDSNQIIEIP